MNRLIQYQVATMRFVIAGLLACFFISAIARAVVPPPDGGYPNFNTAEGTKALFGLTTGSANTAVGWFSLFSDTDGSFNTATGAASLLFNTANRNTATGAGALLNNTTAADNTANGAFALLNNTTGDRNTAVGAGALFTNTDGSTNTAVGVDTLHANIGGSGNTASGNHALTSNIGGSANTAIGANALSSNTTGDFNTAIGQAAGSNVVTGSNNVYIGAGLVGVAGESDACYIRSIFGQSVTSGIPVFISSSNRLGTITSSRRFKEDIRPIDKSSEALFALKPVTFRYKKDIDPAGSSQFGLVAEDVENVNSDLVARDEEGKPYTVRYDQVNAMLLNEFLKEHKRVEEQHATIAELKRAIVRLIARDEELAAKLQHVSVQVGMSKPESQVVAER